MTSEPQPVLVMGGGLGGAEFSVVTLFAIVLALLMGFAIQRGATCMVAAVDEWFEKRSIKRARAIGEAGLWVLGGVALLHAHGVVNFMPRGYAISGWTLLGGALLGVGAAVNRACVFGAVARFGNGDWAYVCTPLGYLLGALMGAVVLPHALPQAMPAALSGEAWWLQAQQRQLLVGVGLLIGAWMLWRLAQPIWATGEALPARAWQRWQHHVWQPHEATLVIGVCFVLLLGLAHRWTYPELLGDWARGHWDDNGRRLILFLALGAGAVWGGLSAKRFAMQPWRLARLARYFVGGALMGLGAELVPGANDGLLLLGLPLLWPHAWATVAVMAASIALWLRLPRLVSAFSVGRYT